MDEDLDVKKPRGGARTPYISTGSVRRAMLATTELFRGMSLASADAFGALSKALDSDRTDDDDLLRSVADGIAGANRRYFDAMADTTKRLADVVVDEGQRYRGGTEAGNPEVDYERLARMVADELRRDAGGTGAAGAPGATGARGATGPKSTGPKAASDTGG